MTVAASDAIRSLRTQRPRSVFLRVTAASVLAIVVLSWQLGDFGIDHLISERRLQNVHRFLAELRPHPLQDRSFDAAIAWRWARELLAGRGGSAALATLAISIAAIVLAAIVAAALCLLAASTVATPDPFVGELQTPSSARRVFWRVTTIVSRSILVFARAVPEYIWAFLLLILLGASAWPAILALAIHNSGILGKLMAEVVEDLDRSPLAALRALGASRAQIAVTGIFPLVFNRGLLFFFYRWETCVRDATILGLLGIVSLGYWIQDARARNHYDEMVFLMLIGAALVLFADMISTVARETVRRSS